MKQPWLRPLLALVSVYLLFSFVRPDTFTGSDSLITMTRQTVVLGIVTIGMTLVILQGGIDLSVGSAVALTTVVLASLLRWNWAPFWAVVAAMLVPTLTGCLMGSCIAALRVTPFIVTLGGMSILRGLAKGIAGEQKIDTDSQGLEFLLEALPPEKSWMILPAGVWMTVALVALAAALIRYTTFGHHIVAIGSNEQTARLCGVRVRFVKTAVYALTGLLAGLAGVMEFSTLTVGDPTDSYGLELEAIAAVVIGADPFREERGRSSAPCLAPF